MGLPKLTLRNEKDFFTKLKVSDLFEYSQSSFLWEDVKRIAQSQGVEVEYNSNDTLAYREYGCFTGKVTEGKVLSWKDVFNSNHVRHGHIERVWAVALANGYPYFTFNDVIYKVEQTQYTITDYTVK